MRHSAFRLLVSIGVLLLLSTCNGQPTTQNGTPTTRESALDRITRTKRVTIGYAGYPPYLRRDPNTQQMSGYSVELANRIFGPLKITIDWKETTWDTMKQDLLLQKFDLMVEPIFYTLPRAAQVSYTQPYAYFGYAIPVVRKGDRRFRTMSDLNSPTVTLAITQGVTDQEYATSNLPRAKVKLIPGNDISITLTEVLTGKVDAALADVPTVLTFVRAHPREVEALYLDNPPAITPAGFIVRPADQDLLNFLNTSLTLLETQGVFDALESQFDLPSFRQRKEWIVGKALRNE